MHTIPKKCRAICFTFCVIGRHMKQVFLSIHRRAAVSLCCMATNEKMQTKLMRVVKKDGCL